MKRKRAAELLEVDLHSPRDKIDSKFRRKSRTLHPDRNGDEATEGMAELSKARHLLQETAEICQQKMQIIDIKTPVITGQTFSGEISFEGKCSLCKGMGMELPDDPDDCVFCNGGGIIYPSKSEKMQCVHCLGTGAGFKCEYLCSKCKGKKFETVKTHVRFDVPEKILKGQLLFKKPFGGRNGVKEIHIISE